ncbi:MAG: flagellar filament capping protein FliD [Lachnospiraceae bacterium]|nr:flagellar filament capping protein FliD [Lachnospiraceae bacterium]
MRITSSMVSEASTQAGISMGGNTLASYLNGDTSKTLASSLGENHHSTLDSLNKGKYQKQKEEAERLEQYADSLCGTGDNSIYAKAKESDDASEVYDEVEKMVSAYNGMLDKLRTDMTTLGRFYQSSLKEAVTENKNGLKELGITIDKNGRMVVDKEKLRAADIDKVESVFGETGTLSPKLGMIAEKVADNAQANLKSASSQYNAAGNSVDTLIRSYDAKR